MALREYRVVIMATLIKSYVVEARSRQQAEEVAHDLFSPAPESGLVESCSRMTYSIQEIKPRYPGLAQVLSGETEEE